MFNDENENRTSKGTRSSILIVASVSLTLLVAILFTLSDRLQERIPAPNRPTLLAQVVVSITSAPTSLLLQNNNFETVSATATPSATPSLAPQPNTNDPGSLPTSTAVPILASSLCGVAPDSWIPYEIKPNDSLLKIAADSGATVAEISQANCLASSILYARTVIFIPGTIPERPACGPPQWWTRYIVQPGDTLFSLALTRGTTVFAIMQANCLVSSTIYFGRNLYLPPAQVSNTATPIPTDTDTATPTMVPTQLPTAIATATPTRIASATAVPIPTNTSTPTLPPTVTDTPTNQPTATSTASPSATPTFTPSPPPSATPSPTPTFTPVPTDTPTLTPTPTESPSPTLTPTVIP